jgi:hypothetical protein
MVCYQAILLAGYTWSHLITRKFSFRVQVGAQALVLLAGAIVIPFALPGGSAVVSGVTPALWLARLLFVMAGLPLFAVSTMSPLLQRWYSASRAEGAEDPYFLYVASNAGSLGGLLAYPLLIEPRTTLPQQASGWAVAFGVLIALTVGCAAITARSWRNAAPARPSPPVAWSRRLRWAACAAVASSLMLSVTSYVSSEVASAPLLWAVPLAIYLLTFVIAFARRPVISHAVARRAVPIALLPAAMALSAELTEPILLLTVVHLHALFIAALACHGELARDRPAASQLTDFYFWISLGGVVGGALNALAAPLLFSRITEYPLMLVATALVTLPADDRRARLRDVALALAPAGLSLAFALGFQVNDRPTSPGILAVVFGMPLVLCFFFSARRTQFVVGLGAVLLVSQFFTVGDGRIIFNRRDFYGIHRVSEDSGKRFHRLLHGRTVHGIESLADPVEPLAYYHRTGPLGDVFQAIAPAGTVAAVGLGAGAVASYLKAGQPLVVYELDPAVVEIARDPRLFQYLSKSEGAISVVLGDARLSLSAAADGAYQLIVLDAYSGDAVPVHLLTREALALSLKKLAPHGVLAFHLSSRHTRLRPVVAGLARDAGLHCRVKEEADLPEADVSAGKLPSHWVVVARTEEDLGRLAADGSWEHDPGDPKLPVWTDDFSSLVQVLDFER